MQTPIRSDRRGSMVQRGGTAVDRMARLVLDRGEGINFDEYVQIMTTITDPDSHQEMSLLDGSTAAERSQQMSALKMDFERMDSDASGLIELEELVSPEQKRHDQMAEGGKVGPRGGRITTKNFSTNIVIGRSEKMGITVEPAGYKGLKCVTVGQRSQFRLQSKGVIYGEDDKDTAEEDYTLYITSVNGRHMTDFTKPTEYPITVSLLEGLGVTVKADREYGLVLTASNPGSQVERLLHEKFGMALSPDVEPTYITQVNGRMINDAFSYRASQTLDTSSRVLASCVCTAPPEGMQAVAAGGVYVSKGSDDGTIPAGCYVVALNGFKLVKIKPAKALQAVQKAGQTNVTSATASVVASSRKGKAAAAAARHAQDGGRGAASGEATGPQPPGPDATDDIKLELLWCGCEGFLQHELHRSPHGRASVLLSVENNALSQQLVLEFLTKCRGSAMAIEVTEEVEHLDDLNHLNQGLRRSSSTAGSRRGERQAAVLADSAAVVRAAPPPRKFSSTVHSCDVLLPAGAKLGITIEPQFYKGLKCVSVSAFSEFRKQSKGIIYGEYDKDTAEEDYTLYITHINGRELSEITRGLEYADLEVKGGALARGACFASHHEKGIALTSSKPDGGLAQAVCATYGPGAVLDPARYPTAITFVDGKQTINAEAQEFSESAHINTRLLGECTYAAAAAGFKGVEITQSSDDGTVPAGCIIVKINNIDLTALPVNRAMDAVDIVKEAGGVADMELLFTGAAGMMFYRLYTNGSVTVRISVETAEVQGNIGDLLMSCRGDSMHISVVEEVEHLHDPDVSAASNGGGDGTGAFAHLLTAGAQ